MSETHRLSRLGLRKKVAVLISVALAATVGGFVQASAAQRPNDIPPSAFNINTDNAAFKVIYPMVGPRLRTFIDPVAMDGTLVLRVSAVLETAWYDATAPYDPTAVGVYAKLGRRPASERTNKNINIAMLYSGYRVMNSLIPPYANDWRTMLTSVGLNPDDNSQDITTPVGLGNVAGETMVKERENDGMNQLGNADGQKYFQEPYQNYTTYTPVNTPFKIIDPSHWQPEVVTSGNGRFFSQVFVTPQAKDTKPFSLKSPTVMVAPVPTASNWQKNPTAYKAQTDAVMKVQDNLTDAQKMQAELFNDKLNVAAVFPDLTGGACGRNATATSCTPRMLLDFVQQAATVHIASFDAQLVSWFSKIKYDAPRPFTAVHWLYGNATVTGWGGPGKGTVTDLPGSDWHSYLQTPDHAEYPSGTSAFCGAQTEVGRLWTGTDKTSMTATFAPGSSYIEPGFSPKKQVTLQWNSWTDILKACEMSRVYAGVHFPPATQAGGDLGTAVGKIAFAFMKAHIAGKA